MLRKGLIISAILHAVLLLVVWIKVPDLFPEPEVKVLKVKLVAAKEVKKVEKQEEQIKKSKSQQSDAPKEAPKPTKAQPKTEKPKRDTKMLTPKQAVAAKKIKQPEPKQPKVEKEQKAEVKESRPEKLDKTPNKKNIVKDTTPDAKPSKDDDFLAALDFIKDLEAKNSALVEAEDTEKTSISNADAAEIAMLKKHIERNWYRPPGIKNLGQLEAHVEVRLSRDGSIEHLELVKSSGEGFYDGSLMRAVRKSAPFPIPADKFDVFKILELRFRG